MSKREIPKQGQTLWLFDLNRRVYTDERDWSARRILYAEHWVEATVVRAGPKNLFLATVATPEKGSSMHTLKWAEGLGRYQTVTEHVAYTRQEVDDDIWRANNRHRLTNMVEGCKDVAVLKQIAALVGYTEV